MLVLVAHGSRDPRWRSSVEGMVEALQREVGAGRVRLAYMDLTPPTLLDVASVAAREGVTTLRVLPLFLAGEGHVERDVRPLLEEVRRSLPQVHVVELLPMGQDPAFRAALARIARRPEPLEDALAVGDESGGEAGDPRPRPGRWGWWAP
jgi:sirohydrochlorin cobaltochelatase